MPNSTSPLSPTAPFFIGLMSGTSLDGVDGVLVAFDDTGTSCRVETLAAAHTDFPAALREQLLDLQVSGNDEIHREAIAAQALTHCYAACVGDLLRINQCQPDQISAIGAHGQTIRHRPESGYTRQINAGALLAELTGIDVVVDFRSRDLAAGGQGAPLVPAFHQRIFAAQHAQRVIANLGGIANISVLPALDGKAAPITGFDTGPANVLLDLWIGRHRGVHYDAAGSWAASGTVCRPLLAALRNEPFFAAPPPKSTGRDLFNAQWLDQMLAPFADVAPVDVQATLTELTATTLADAIRLYAPDADAVFVCGGGACNTFLMSRIAAALAAGGRPLPVRATTELGVPADQVEALAFAWLALRFTQRRAGNLAAVTGATGERILGALYPA
jgi:anhydro-N-acetylmuramic acid kinase